MCVCVCVCGSNGGGGGGGDTPMKIITLNDAWTYLMEVKETFQDKREKYDIFLKFIIDFMAQRYIP